jgi:hypothetical protein
MALHDLSTFEQLLIDLESLLHAIKENIVVHYIYGVLQWDTIFAAFRANLPLECIRLVRQLFCKTSTHS